MTCASCAVRVEKRPQPAGGRRRLGELRHRDGERVASTRVVVEPETLVAAVERAGYGARLPSEREAASRGRRADPTVALRRRVVVSALLSLPVLLLSMIPALQFDDWQWLALDARHAGRALGGLAVPPGRLGQPPPRRRHDGHPDLGRHAGRLRLVALRAVLPRRRRPGMRMAFDLVVDPGARRRRTSTSRSPRSSPPSSWPGATSRRAPSAGRARPCGRCSSSAPRRSSSRRGRRRAPRPDRASSRSATASSCARARRSPPTAWSKRAPRPSTPRCSPARACRSRSARATRSPGPPSTPAAGCGARDTGRGRHRSGADRPAGRPTRSRARRRSSAWPTGSRRSSCRS